jgi:hypothetical protein
MFGLAAALLMAEAALATVPFTNDVFGKLESTLDYCAQVDSGSAAKYKEKKKALVKDVPENEVTDARNSDEYKEAYDSITAALSKLSKERVSQACNDVVATKK